MSDHVKTALVSAVTASVVSVAVCFTFFSFKMMAVTAAIGEARTAASAVKAAGASYLEETCRERPELRRCALLKMKGPAAER